MKQKTPEQIVKKRDELQIQMNYLHNFLSSKTPGYSIGMVDQELLTMKREIDILTWVLDDGIPF